MSTGTYTEEYFIGIAKNRVWHLSEQYFASEDYIEDLFDVNDKFVSFEMHYALKIMKLHAVTEYCAVGVVSEFNI